jgi:hypothetical protein
VHVGQCAWPSIPLHRCSTGNWLAKRRHGLAISPGGADSVAPVLDWELAGEKTLWARNLAILRLDSSQMSKTAGWRLSRPSSQIFASAPSALSARLLNWLCARQWTSRPEAAVIDDGADGLAGLIVARRTCCGLTFSARAARPRRRGD